MSVINATPLLAAAGGDYQISRSVRLRSSASAYFNRTPASAGNRQTWTWSGWVKRGALGGTMCLLAGSDGASSGDAFYFNSDAVSYFQGGVGAMRVSTAVYRDPSAWYHIVGVSDSSNATAQSRFRIYVNGVEITAWATNSTITQNRNGFINSNTLQTIANNTGASQYFDGYLTEVNFIDGQALTPSSFGETDSITGVWKPKKYTGTYGTNGFYLDFKDPTNTTTLTADKSGNGNNWTANNISLTSGVTYDSMIDTPTPVADVRGNFAVLNPVAKSPIMVLSEGNLRTSNATSTNASAGSTIGMTTGKFYWEVTATTVVGSFPMVGIALSSYLGFSQNGYYNGFTADSWGLFNNTGGFVNNNSVIATYSTVSSGDVVMLALDMDNNKFWMGKNGTWFNSGVPASGTGAIVTSGLTGNTVFACISDFLGSSSNANFGQRPFAYTPPSGFKALHTGNLPEPAIKKGNQYFDATTYTGTGSALTVTNSGSMQPDLVWIKSRNNVTNHNLTDAVRGVDKLLFSNATAAEATFSGGLSSFNSGGFSLASGGDVGFSASGYTYVGWQWKESASAGFDIVTYTGTGVATTVAHNLGVAPKMMIIKSRSFAGTDWPVYHASIGNTAYLQLNTTSASITTSGAWNNTSPTSSVFTVGTGGSFNSNTQTYVAYLFAEVAGFSKFGSYTGNGSTDGPFVFCGFRPRFVMIKRTDAAEQWLIWDASRNPNNLTTLHLAANSSSSETTSTVNSIDMLSNGFKQRGSDFATNASGGSYIFAAFAEHPFKNSLAR